MFLQNTYNFYKGYSQIEVEGYFVERFVNLCLIRNLKIWDIEKETEGKIILKIDEKDLGKIDELLNATYSRMKVINKKGIPQIKKLYKKRYVFVGVSFVSYIIISILSLFIWNIEIVGNKNIETSEIRKILADEGLSIGKLKDSVDYKTLKSDIYINRDDVLWIGINTKGVKVTVEIVEREIKEKKSNIPCNIIAEKDGIIEKISVRSGTKKVEVGESVCKGDILVSGIMESEYSESIMVTADADIKIKTWYTDKLAIPYEKTILTMSGKKEKKYKLCFGKYGINLTNNSTKFEKYDTISTVKKLRLFGKFETPINLETKEYNELISNNVKYTKEQAMSIAKEDVYKSIIQTIPKDAEIIDCNYNFFEDENEVIVRIVLECLENIGRKEEITF